MKMRSFVFAAILMIGSLSMHVAHATDTFDTAYRETTFLMVEADLRLHLCHLKEFSLHLLQPSQAATGADSPAPLGPTSQAIRITEEHASYTVFLCRKEAEEAIRARLQAAEQELLERPLAQEKLKGFIAAWLSAMKVIPRTAPGRVGVPRFTKELRACSGKALDQTSQLAGAKEGDEAGTATEA